jgi:acid phosphatase type 7
MKRFLVVFAVLALAVAAWALRPWRSEPPVRPPHGAYVPSGPTGRALVWAVGDGADGGTAAQAVVTRMRRKRFDRVLYLGDVYGGGILSALRGDGTATDFHKRYDPIYGDFAKQTAPTPGNHEWPQRGDGYEPYWTAVFGHPPPAYYDFRVAGWQILSLNSQAPHGAGSQQLRWLRTRLRAPGTCRLAFWHRPRFSAGDHGDAPDMAPLWDALPGRASVVVSGHDHDMQRFEPIDGITQYVSGAGGHGHYALRSDSRLAFGNDRDYGALRIELRPGRARLAFVSAAGRILDTSTVRCVRAAGQRSPSA